MIVQSATEGQPRFVIPMTEHLSLAGQFARAFGNDRFEPVSPRDEMIYIAEHHDDGWAEIDAAAEIDPRTNLPYSLSETPFDFTLRTSVASPERNSRHHAYCGLLSSMHSFGLFNGRYGLQKFVRTESLEGDELARAKDLLDGELARQQRLKAILAEDPETAAWIEDEHLFRNYRQLQFFDTLALYFNRTHEGARKTAVFPKVPMRAGEDADVAVTPRGNGVYSVDPFPFAGDMLEVTFAGHYMTPLADGEPANLEAREMAEQTYRLVAG